jgi:hypothetical protein
VYCKLLKSDNQEVKCAEPCKIVEAPSEHSAPSHQEVKSKKSKKNKKKDSSVCEDVKSADVPPQPAKTR